MDDPFADNDDGNGQNIREMHFADKFQLQRYLWKMQETFTFQ